MNIQRLKFAHARGARIQVDCAKLKFRHAPEPHTFEFENGWFVSATVLTERADRLEQKLTDKRWRLRIHPEDEHLQYGPISSVMLEWAKAPSFSSTSDLRSSDANWHAARHYWLAARFPTDLDGGAPESYSMTEMECRVLALFLAEERADEGL